MNDAALKSSIDHHILVKSTQVLIGICSGMVADGDLNDAEIRFLTTWLAEHRDVASVWPGDVIARRVQAIVADGVITSDERSDLLQTLSSITGNEFIDTGSASVAGPYADFDEGEIRLVGSTFCLTGTFFLGTRAKCEKAIEASGGVVANSVTKDLDYLIVGSGCTGSWVNETWGRKIELAIERRKRYGNPSIVTEEKWTRSIQSSQPAA